VQGSFNEVMNLCTDWMMNLVSRNLCCKPFKLQGHEFEPVCELRAGSGLSFLPSLVPMYFQTTAAHRPTQPSIVCGNVK